MALSANTFGFHLVNVALHGAVTALLCRLARKVLHLDAPLTLIAATLFATHPIHCEAVSSIVGRADLLCALFYLTAFLAFHKCLEKNQTVAGQAKYLLHTVLCSILALLSKETGITVFGVCAFYWLLRQRRQTLGSNPSRLVPIGAITVSFCIILITRLRLFGDTLPYFSEQDNPASYSKSILTRILTYLHLAVFNVQLLIRPLKQSYDWQTSSIHLVDSLADYRNIGTVILVLLCGVLLYRVGKSWLKVESSHPITALSLSLSFIVLPYVPASNLFLTVGFVIAERLLYIPSIGFVCLLCLGLERIRNWSQKLPAKYPLYHCICQPLIACLVIIYATKTIQQNSVWRTRETLYKSGIVAVPENAKAHYNYANLLQDGGNWNEAMYHYHTAIRLWPEHASAQNNLGALYWRLSKPDHAERHFMLALQINPYHAKAHFNLAKIYSKRGQTQEAIVLLERSIRLDGQFAESYDALATLHARNEQLPIAERLHNRALRLRPRNADFLNNYGAFLQRTGRVKFALRQYHRALEIKPNHVIAMLNMAHSFSILQRYEQAEHYFKRALKLKEDPATLDSLGTLYLRQAKLEPARLVYEYMWSKYGDSGSASEERKHVPNTVTPRYADVATIHYAQLLILEQRYSDAEVLLEALTRLDDGSSNNNNSGGIGSLVPGTEEVKNQNKWQSPSLRRRRTGKQKRIIKKSDPESNQVNLQWIPDNGSMVSNQTTGEENEINMKRWPPLPQPPPPPAAEVDRKCKQEISKQDQREPQLIGSNEESDQSSLLIDVHHQLALLYTLTNRTAEALDSISNALRLCDINAGNGGSLSGVTNSITASSSGSGWLARKLIEIQNRCAQILTLQGDLQKDLHQWHDAIESYKQAIQLDQCLARAHLHLAVIYHIEARYTEAMAHYTFARQLDSGPNRQLIEDNIGKLRRRQLMMAATATATMPPPTTEALSLDPPFQEHCRQRYLLNSDTIGHQSATLLPNCLA